MRKRSSALTVTDQFCGAGGSTQGALEAGAEVRLALNHWERACETYAANHPATAVDRTDISACDPRRYAPTDILITSPECTNHSLAKGQRRTRGQLDAFVEADFDPAAERSRATMWDVWRFAEYHDYRAIIVENVVDARDWLLWDAWWLAGQRLGYDGRCVYLNSMHAHPTPQSRDRMYVVWWKRENRAPDLEIRPSAWCGRCARDVRAVQTWKRQDRQFGRYRRQYLYCCATCGTAVEPYYYAALNALDLGKPAERIGDRKRPLTARTMARIAFGLERYGRQPIYLHVANNGGGRSHEMDGRVRGAASGAALTQTGTAHHGLAFPQPWLVDTVRTNEGERRVWSVSQAARTQTTQRELGVALPPAFGVTLRANADARELSEPAPTVAAEGNHHALAISPMLIHTRRQFDTACRIRNAATDACGAQTASTDFAVVHGGKVMTLRDPLGGFVHSDVTDPVMTQLGRQQAALVQRAPFLVQYHYGKLLASGVTDTVPTQVAREAHAVLDPRSLDEIAVEDLYFRMLDTDEIQRTMAFADSYIVTGNKRDRVKQLGNAVTPPAMRLLLARVLASLEPEIAHHPNAEMIA